MADFLRNFGIGIINLLGVAVPGALLIGLAMFGFLFPMTAVLLNLSGNSVSMHWPRDSHWVNIATVCVHFSIAMFAVLSYVAGYILRLTSPDGLDRASVGWMQKNGNASFVTSPDRMDNKVEKDGRAYKDAFPYWGFGTFLELLGHDELREHVTWTDQTPQKCSNSRVNMWKGDIALYCPDLAATVNSEEAHVRLMSGTWLAIRTTSWAVGACWILTLAALLLPHVLSWDWYDSIHFRESAWFYAIQLSISTAMLFGMSWAQTHIVMLFHKKRVGELLLVCHAKHHADERKKQMNGNASLTNA